MKIVLVRPCPSAETIGLQHVMICEPLELEYLCSAIDDLGHETTIVDMILEKASIKQFIQELQPDVLVVTGYITHVEIVKNYCRTAKELLPGCRTIVGGVHAEVVPEDWEDSSIDYIVSRNPIDSFRQIILSMGGQQCELSGVWRPGCELAPGNRSFDHAFPDRAKVERYRSRYYYLFHNPCALIKTSFGCPYKCEFCFCRQITGDEYFTRDIDSVIEELKSLPEKDIYIVDDNFLVSRERLEAFCDAIEREGVAKKYLIYGRSDFIAANEDIIARLKECGLRAVIVGIESCRADELKGYNKNSDVASNEAAVEILQRYDIDCYATLILGMDWKESDFKMLGRWLRRLKLTYINLQPFTPLPGTPMLEKYNDGLIVPRTDYEKWDLAHLVLAPTQMSQARYYWNIVKLYHWVTMRPQNILKLLYRHGPRENLKLWLGSVRVTLQYLSRIRRHLSGKEA